MHKILTEVRSAGYKAGLFTSDLNRDKRAKTFDEFDTGAITILVTTDIGSRGLDMKESVSLFKWRILTYSQVEHVILYEFPLNAIDYLHRIGRTARAGKKGLVTSFFGARDQALVEQIRVCSFSCCPLSYMVTRMPMPMTLV